MKKTILLFALICFLSAANAMQPDPYTKEDFAKRMNTAISHNRQQVNIPEIDPFLEEGTQEYEIQVAERNQVIANLERLDVLKEQAIEEYNVFFDAYHLADAEKVKEQVQKLKVIFDEMNGLMRTIIKFDEIYLDIFYWSVQLDYLIEQGAITPNKDPIDNSKPIKAVDQKTVEDNPVADCCETEPEGNCCKAKKSISCCEEDPESKCCLQPKPQQDNFLVLVVIFVVLFIVAAGILSLTLRR